MEMPVARILSSNLPIVEREGRLQEIAAYRQLSCPSPFSPFIISSSSSRSSTDEGFDADGRGLLPLTKIYWPPGQSHSRLHPVNSGTQTAHQRFKALPAISELSDFDDRHGKIAFSYD